MLYLQTHICRHNWSLNVISCLDCDILSHLYSPISDSLGLGSTRHFALLSLQYSCLSILDQLYSIRYYYKIRSSFKFGHPANKMLCSHYWFYSNWTGVSTTSLFLLSAIFNATKVFENRNRLLHAFFIQEIRKNSKQWFIDSLKSFRSRYGSIVFLFLIRGWCLCTDSIFPWKDIFVEICLIN